MGHRSLRPPFWTWVLAVATAFGILYYSCDEVGSRLPRHEAAGMTATDLLVRQERVVRGLRQNLERACRATTAFRWHLEGAPETWPEDLREEYDMHMEIVRGLSHACDTAAEEYNRLAGEVGPESVRELGFPQTESCEVDTYSP